jgi:hypothetical protein
LLAALTGKGLSHIHSMPQDNGGLGVIEFQAGAAGKWVVKHINL